MVKKSELQLWNKIKPLARDKRREPTAAEAILWQELRSHGINGYKFRRQQPVGRFIVDFCCLRAKLVIEVDGPIHQQTQDEDKARQVELEAIGLRVIRFTNDEVIENTKDVLASIQAALETANDDSSNFR